MPKFDDHAYVGVSETVTFCDEHYRFFVGTFEQNGGHVEPLEETFSRPEAFALARAWNRRELETEEDD